MGLLAQTEDDIAKDNSGLVKNEGANSKPGRNSLAMHKKSFYVDGLVSEVTFYIAKSAFSSDDEQINISLEDPKKNVITKGTNNPKVKWLVGKGFEFVTVTNPQPGNWSILGLEEGGGFTTALTNLKLKVDWPKDIASETDTILEAQLHEGNRPLRLSGIIRNLKFAYQIVATDRIAEPIASGSLTDDGTNGDRVANDGIFSSTVKVSARGTYDLKVLAKSPTFKRDQTFDFLLRGILVQLSVDNDYELNGGRSGVRKQRSSRKQRGEVLFRVKDDKDAGLKNIRVKLVAETPEGGEVFLKLKHDKSSKAKPASRKYRDENYSYIGASDSLKTEGAYNIKAILRAKDAGGKRLEVPSNSLTFYRNNNKIDKESHGFSSIYGGKIGFYDWEDAGSVWPFIIFVTVVNGILGTVVFLLVNQSIEDSKNVIQLALPNISDEVEQLVAKFKDISEEKNIEVSGLESLQVEEV